MTDTATDTRVHFATLASMQALVGQHLATSPWVTVDQDRINMFAQATGDHQWIHVDVERAKAGPYGAPIAHGFLTLSLLPELAASAMCIDWADRPFPLDVLREKLCGGLADMLLESLAPAHREPLLAWRSGLSG